MTEHQHSSLDLVVMLCVCTILASAVATSRGGDLPCEPAEGRECLRELLPLHHCNASLQEDGRVRVLCKILIKAAPQLYFIPSDPEVMTMDERLVSDAPPKDGKLAALSLTRVDIKKWDDFPLTLQSNYDVFRVNASTLLEQLALYSFMCFVRQVEFSVTFEKPLKIAVANCSKTQGDAQLRCDVYGFKGRFVSNDSLPAIFEKFPDIGLTLVLIFRWNVQNAVTPKINVTLSGRVKSIPSALRIITPFRIAHLVLYKCNFDHVGSKEAIPLMPYLKQLDFVHVPITRVHINAFDLIPHIESISLVGTQLASIPESVYNLKKLRRLNMAATVTSLNGTFLICPGICRQSSSLRELILAGTTRLQDLRDGVFCAFRNLQLLDLGGCSIKQLYGSPFVCLQHLRELDMQSNQIATISEEALLGLMRLEILNLSHNRIGTVSGAAIFRHLTSLVSLDVSFNEVKNLEHLSTRAASVRFLDLSHNSISEWSPPFFSAMGSLLTLVLSSNLIYTIDNGALRDIRRVKTVNISDNPWDCGSCSLNNLHDLLNSSARLGANSVVCKEPERYVGLRAIDVEWDVGVCGPMDFYTSVWVPLLFTALAATVISYGLYTKRWYMMYALLYLRVKIKNYKRQLHCGRFMWDAFLCYHVSDATWTTEVLLARLESPPMRYRVCVAERDFIPGIPITENICRCISQSRVSLFVLSSEFCRSRWCMFEMMLAQHRLFESDRDEHIVLIRKGPIDESQMCPTLSYLTSSRTYIGAPESESDERLQDLFWLQLQMALQQ